MRPRRPRQRPPDDLTLHIYQVPISDFHCKDMAARIRLLRFTKLSGPGARDLNFAGQNRILRCVRSFSSTRTSAQASETTPTHAFSNGQNLGSISLKKNGIYLDNKLRIVSGIPVRLHRSPIDKHSDSVRRPGSQGTSRQRISTLGRREAIF